MSSGVVLVGDQRLNAKQEEQLAKTGRFKLTRWQIIRMLRAARAEGCDHWAWELERETGVTDIGLRLA